MEKRRSKAWWLIAVAVLVIVCLIFASVLYFFQRARNYNPRPLVLIHNPLNRDMFVTGEGIVIHATGRSPRGIEHMELWVDNVLQSQKTVGDQPASPLVLTADWVPTITGSHLIVVRAISSDGVTGQSSVGVVVVENSKTGSIIHIVEEGETLNSIAENYGTSPEDLTSLNPGLAPDDLAPGESLHIPSGEPFTAGDEEAVTDVTSPSAELESPSDTGGVVEAVTDVFAGPATGRRGLQVEILQLMTSINLEGLHCYVGLAGNAPLWYPDADGNQSTDESFGILGSEGPSFLWDVEPYLTSTFVPVLFWEETAPLPLEVACVGVSGGGTEALDLGWVALSIPPEDWNGITRSIGTAGTDGGFEFLYRVNSVGDRPRNVPMFLDPDMSAPFNARLDDRRISLRWDYEPPADVEPIDGFRIYLNGNLQWIESPDDRESGLPYEWFNPPCGTRYTFSVTAFRYGFPDGPESFPSLAFIETPAENCNREIQINFLSLETLDLGGDGRYEDRSGDVGPPYGYFFANENRVTFDTRPAEWRGGSLDMPHGLTHNTTYDLMSMSANPTWHYSGMPSTLVDVPFGGSFQFGFHIMDEDTGRCRNSSDPGCDDLICEGFSAVYTESASSVLAQQNEGVLNSDDGRCRLTYSFGPAFGSPVGSGVEGWEPLPWINVEDLKIDEGTGQLQIHVRNTGTATWPWRDLTVQLQTREGEIINILTWSEYVLESGQRDVLDGPGLRLEAPFDACVLIDPNNEVLEEYERSGALFHTPVCPALPDLTISSVGFDPTAAGRLRVVVRNDGEGPLKNRTLVVKTLLPDGSPLYIGGSYPNVSLEPRQERFYEFGGVTETIRERMRQGYSVVVNPDATIVESNLDNNSFNVGGGQRLWVYWYGIWSPYSLRNQVEYDFDAFIVSGSARRQVADWHIGQDIDWGSCFSPRYCVRTFSDNQHDTYWFDIYGDEHLEVLARVTHPGGYAGEWPGSDIFGPSENWGGGPPFNYGCSYSHTGPGSHTWHLGSHEGNNWSIVFHICQQDLAP